MDTLSNFLLAAALTFIGFSIAVPLILYLGRIAGLYAIVQERRSQVYILFGKVIGTIDEAGLHFLPAKLGLAAFLVNWLGKCEVVDLRLDQTYLRSQPVNSEEGAPMGIGIWYEMFVSDPVSFLFKNTDPRGSLSANVSNSTVRCLSNLPLADMLVNRHVMSDTVRNEVTPKSHEWGYKLGSVYIRKVHFRDAKMIKQIESKVVNRLRQVTSAIKQDGVNQVSVITSTAEKTAAIELAKAAAVRPEIVGNALRDISNDPDVAQAVFDVLEAQKIINGKATVTLMPASSSGLLTNLLAAQPARRDVSPPPVRE
ncbi:SPFH domain-containing protein [Prosthecobacter sp.]|uniref:SPFH domain-containing protein n=1 Tax=Prosthecobacter sp. TaxID=1965333 RepID=UPI002487D9F6|nr:SPFH domain-containing protein [Prosthecobacter sp.]MDI1314773.1 SPFH domain-containing protein [Prosthecobacter sp.]